MAQLASAKGEMKDWLSVWGTAIATIIFALCTLTRQFNAPPIIWTDWATAATVTMFVSGLWTALVGPFKLVQLSRVAKVLSARTLANDLCQQILTTIHQAKPALPIEGLAVHVWRVKGDSLDRMASYRVERRSDSGVTWTKGKGAIGLCWSTNLEIEADLVNLHSAAVGGESAFYNIDEDKRFYLTWDEYQMTRRYQSIFVTPLRNESMRFVGCLSIDTTTADHAEFMTACRGSAVLGLMSLIEQVLGDSA